ncbi:MAG: LysR family transcriptional regulator, partial [Cellvibrionaceae bacterium]|nr:LysR family transcriptional regulator [Cellvibrionaceae bacterium]
MDTRQLARIDLNLLVALQVLLEERNVSRAADRLFITQSAMSKTLGRLRELFDDPLFTRSSHGMVPTPKALELQPLLQKALGQVQALTTGSEFEPAAFEGEISIAVAEYVGVVLLPALMQILQAEAPLLRVRTLSRVERQLDELTDGGLDFAIHMR